MSRFEPRHVHLFERAQSTADEVSKNLTAVKRAWDRIAHLAIRVYPPVPNKDMYFVNIKEARPNLALKDSGSESFFRAMRRAGLMRPLRTDALVHDMWMEYVQELRLLLGLAPPTRHVAPAPAPAQICFPPLQPLALETSSPVLFPSAMESSFCNLSDEASLDPDSPPASADDQLLASPEADECVAAAPAPPSSGAWSDLSALLSDTSSEELNVLCRELIDVLDADC